MYVSIFTEKPAFRNHSKEDKKLIFNDHYSLMQVKSIAECSNGAFCNTIHSTFIKLPFVFKTFVLSIFEWPLKTGFTVFTDWFHFLINTTQINIKFLAFRPR